MLTNDENRDSSRKEVPLAIEVVEPQEDNQPGIEIVMSPRGSRNNNTAARTMHNDIRAIIEAQQRDMADRMRRAQNEMDDRMRAAFAQHENFFNRSNRVQFSSNSSQSHRGRGGVTPTSSAGANQQFFAQTTSELPATAVVMPQRSVQRHSPQSNYDINPIGALIVYFGLSAGVGALGGLIGAEVMKAGDWTVLKIDTTDLVESMTVGSVILAASLLLLAKAAAKYNPNCSTDSLESAGLIVAAGFGAIASLLGTVIFGLLIDEEHIGFSAAAGAVGMALVYLIAQCRFSCGIHNNDCHLHCKVPLLEYNCHRRNPCC